MSHQCPVCGYPGLTEPPSPAEGGGSYEVCPSCGFHFGVDDEDRGISFAQWRSKWVRAGMPWFSRGQPKPPGWDAGTQLDGLSKKRGARRRPGRKTQGDE